jgi:hypothetical protein
LSEGSAVAGYLSLVKLPLLTLFSLFSLFFSFGLACPEAPKVVSVGCYIKIAGRKPILRSFSLEPKLTKKQILCLNYGIIVNQK